MQWVTNHMETMNHMDTYGISKVQSACRLNASYMECRVTRKEAILVMCGQTLLGRRALVELLLGYKGPIFSHTPVNTNDARKPQRSRQRGERNRHD